MATGRVLTNARPAAAHTPRLDDFEIDQDADERSAVSVEQSMIAT